TRTALSIYPWDIVTEIETRLESPQAMLLVVPNGKVKLLNALPFAPADLRRDSLETAWRADPDPRPAPRGGGVIRPRPPGPPPVPPAHQAGGGGARATPAREARG